MTPTPAPHSQPSAQTLVPGTKNGTKNAVPGTSGCDVVVVGGGIVGLATALQLQTDGASVRVLEKESRIAQHQTGRNSGVVHSGLYYAPGSLKARLCRHGRSRLIDFCRDEGLQLELCGKVVVATSDAEASRLPGLAERGRENGVTLEVIDEKALREIEPFTRGVAGLFVEDTGIVDYGAVTARLAERLRERGGGVEPGVRLTRAREAAGRVLVTTSQGEREAKVLLNCAGLHADRVALASGIRPPVTIVPFRGDYYELAPDHAHLCRNLIYPVPDPGLPFLGVHFTRMIHGGVECGPSAVLAFAREGYTPTTLRIPDLARTLTTPGFWRLARRHWKTGIDELVRTFSRARFTHRARQLIPAVRPEMLRRGHAGVRAQALAPDGRLVDDFVIEETDRGVHVLNAPSPAATASLAIGEHLADRVRARL